MAHPLPYDGCLLPPMLPEDVGKKTLVLDLDETLVHSSFKPMNADFVISVEIEGRSYLVYVAKRPGVDQFLERLSSIFEIVIFTASVGKYAAPLLDLLDPRHVVRARLFRESCCWHEGNYVKDLTHLGRDLRSIIIIDNSPASYIFQPLNAIPVNSWYATEGPDTELADLVPFLEAVARTPDVTVSLNNEQFWEDPAMRQKVVQLRLLQQFQIQQQQQMLALQQQQMYAFQAATNQAAQPIAQTQPTTTVTAPPTPTPPTPVAVAPSPGGAASVIHQAPAMPTLPAAKQPVQTYSSGVGPPSTSSTAATALPVIAGPQPAPGPMVAPPAMVQPVAVQPQFFANPTAHPHLHGPTTSASGAAAAPATPPPSPGPASGKLNRQASSANRLPAGAPLPTVSQARVAR